MILRILTYTHHTTTLLFGIFLSAFFLGVKQDKKNVMKLLLPAAGSGSLYVLISYGFGTVIANRFYPLIVHLPLLCVLVLYYKFRPLPSLISIFTAYLCCQCSNWMGLFALSVTGQEWCYYVCRILVTVGTFILLCRYVCQTTTMLFAKTDRELLIIGSLPVIYYIFDYATTKFSSLLYTGNKAVPEFLGFAICLTYLIFLLVYFREYELKNKAEQYNELIRMQLSSLHTEMESTRKSEQKMSILRHDTRHHLSVIRTLIQQGDTGKALEYLNQISQTYDDTVIKTYCKNEMVNSVLSIYSTRFEEQKIRWETQVTIGEQLPCPDMMFCAILSNVLENAMHAVQELPEDKRYIGLSLAERTGHLLLMAKNSVDSAPKFVDGIPVTERSGHGLGARSIVYYVERLHGQYQFLMENNDFVVRIIL